MNENARPLLLPCLSGPRSGRVRLHTRIDHQMSGRKPLHIPPERPGVDPVTESPRNVDNGGHGYINTVMIDDIERCFNTDAIRPPPVAEEVWKRIQNQHRGYSDTILHFDPGRPGVVP